VRRLIFVFLTILVLAFPRVAKGQGDLYQITDFVSDITIEQDTSLTIIETIRVNFPEPRHGIFRIIPVAYSAKGRTIKADLKVIAVTDEKENGYQYEISRFRQSIKLKIGDSDRTITDLHTYIVKYKISHVLQRFDSHDELYWNVTGSEWDTNILNASAKVTSSNATIIKTECFAGAFGSSEKNCEQSFSGELAEFVSREQLGKGKDLTVVVGLDKENDLLFPGLVEKNLKLLADNWGYPVALLPLLVIFGFWLKKGRDKRYLSDQIYYQPEDKKTRTVSIFERKFLPLVYSPIQGLTPSQVGTIIDEKVDIQDVVAEIVELARLGHIKIEKIASKNKKTDYSFTKLDKSRAGLKKYQKYLLSKLFEKPTSSDNYVLLSSLENNFYKSLTEFKKRLYENLAEEKMFDGNPEKTRTAWIVGFVILSLLGLLVVSFFMITTANFVPIVLSVLTFIPGIVLAINMPRRTAWGYSLFRQTRGLAWYLRKGKWRHEITEKHLFLEEILPLAISLGVVNKLTKDMQGLGVTPPSYLVGVAAVSLSSDIRSFKSTASKSLVSSPGGSWSGSSSWSGGSGFSGGSVGGGFGGGGGGSW